MKQPSNRLRIAIQQKGRLYEKCFDLLQKCGLTIDNSRRKLFSRIKELPIDILYVRDDDIPNFVANGVCDLGIVGENVFKEIHLEAKQELDLEIKFNLGFSKCRLSIAIPEAMEFTSPQNLSGLRIATTYSEILKQYLLQNNVSAEIIKMQGSVEVAPHLKIADLICDIVSSGATLEANGLKEVQTILESQAVLIGNANFSSPEKAEIADKLIKRIRGVLSAKTSKYVMLNAPVEQVEAVAKLLPGVDSPTIVPLENSSKVAIHAVCLEPIFWETMENLKALGCSSILVVPIEKMLE